MNNKFLVYRDIKVYRIEVERETLSSVWVRGRRHAKRSEYENYFDTFEEAKTFLVEQSELKLILARRHLEAAQGAHGNARGLKESDVVTV